jgi:hypothetical protein
MKTLANLANGLCALAAFGVVGCGGPAEGVPNEDTGVTQQKLYEATALGYYGGQGGQAEWNLFWANCVPGGNSWTACSYPYEWWGSDGAIFPIGLMFRYTNGYTARSSWDGAGTWYAGWAGSTPFNWEHHFQCPNNQYIVGFMGRSGGYIDRLSFICGTPDRTQVTWPSSNAWLGNSTGGTAFGEFCPMGQVAVSFHGRMGAWMDGIQMLCNWPYVPPVIF